VLTTAPTARQVHNILWKEIRKLSRRLAVQHFDGPKIDRMSTAPDHFAEGFTSRDGNRFQGQHEAAVFIIFDEGEGVDPIFWEAAESMLGGERYAFLALYNPTQQAGPTVDAEAAGGAHLIRMSCREHPNIQAELAGAQAPFPSAIRLVRLREMMRNWCDSVRDGEQETGDVQLAPGEWFRPKAIAQSRLLGIRPTSAFDAVWSDALWQAVRTREAKLDERWGVQIGCDVAAFGDDYSTIHVRKGMVSLHHESHNGWTGKQLAGRLKQLCGRFASRWQPEHLIPCLIDVGGGYGNAVLENADRYRFVPINSAWALEEREYRNFRSKLWFAVVEAAKAGLMSVARLDTDTQRELGRQLKSVKYTIDAVGRLVVERKLDTKSRLGRSPDDADGFNLAWYPYTLAVEKVIGNVN
jgi:hypothetical protein